VTANLIRLAVSLSALVVASCASSHDAERTDESASVRAPVIAKLRFRDLDLVISGSEAGQRFSVVERGRMPLATGLEEADFRRHHPALYEIYRSGLAQSPYLDARLDRPPADRSSADRF
jgi:hypothetical protein